MRVDRRDCLREMEPRDGDGLVCSGEEADVGAERWPDLALDFILFVEGVESVGDGFTGVGSVGVCACGDDGDGDGCGECCVGGGDDAPCGR